MARKPSLYMLVGVPGSGKSTWIDRHLDHRDAQENVYVASTDDYIELIASSQNKTYNEVFKDFIKDAEKVMYQGVRFATENNMDIIWDQTNLTRKARAKKLIVIPDHYEKIAMVFKTPEESELQRRLASRPGKTIPEYILGPMIESLEWPEFDEGFDVIWAADIYDERREMYSEIKN